MRCPFCAHEDSQVKDSRPTEDNTAIRRRRQCDGCGARFTTFERVQLREILVVKSGGKSEPFDRGKIEQSVMLACRKRGVAQERIDQLVSGIQRQVETAGEAEVPSARIGARRKASAPQQAARLRRMQAARMRSNMLAAVDVKLRAGHVGTGVGAQEVDRLGDLVRRAEAVQGDLLDDFFALPEALQCRILAVLRSDNAENRAK